MYVAYNVGFFSVLSTGSFEINNEIVQLRRLLLIPPLKDEPLGLETSFWSSVLVIKVVRLSYVPIMEPS